MVSESSDSFGLGLDEPPQPAKPQPYRVLARKYRPQSFGELIGQDAMVRTLGNAIARDRLAHMRRGSRADAAFANPVRSGRKQP